LISITGALNFSPGIAMFVPGAKGTLFGAVTFNAVSQQSITF
jgi:hypothetical protein